MMKQHISFRLFLTAIIALFACVSIYAETYLNPFAYRIDNIVECNGNNLNSDFIAIHYSLSAPAESVHIRLWDITNGENQSKWSRTNGYTSNTGNCIQEFPLTGDYLKQGNHTYTIDFTDLIGLSNQLHNKKVRWTIDVVGGNTTSWSVSPTNVTIDQVTGITFTKNPTNSNMGDDMIITKKATIPLKYIDAPQVTKRWNINYPGGVDICTDPYQLNFGVILCTSSRAIEETFKGATLHAFGGGMEHLKTKWDHGQNESTGIGGGVSWGVFEENWRAVEGRMLYGMGPYRVRFADDGRAFLSASLNAQKILYQINTPGNTDGDNFYETWNGGKFTPIFKTGTWDANTATLKSGSNFIAGPNVAFDVQGSGEHLQLLLLSHNKDGALGAKKESFRIDEYNLGTNSNISGPTTTNLLNNTKGYNTVTEKKHATADLAIVGFDNTNIEYDPKGGFWIAQLRLKEPGPLAATLVHRAKDETWEHEEHAINRGKGAIRHNHDFTKLAIAGGFIKDTIFHKRDGSGSYLHKSYYNKTTLAPEGRAYWAQVAKENQITIHDVTYDSNGKASINNTVYINTTGVKSISDFAWDFANNLYVTSRDGVTGTVSDRGLTAFALPNEGNTVSTPCRKEYHFALAPLYNISVDFLPNNQDDNHNNIYGYIKQTNRNTQNDKGVPYTTYLRNAKIELTAVNIPTGCKFYKWTTQASSNNVIEDGNVLTLTALNGNASITAQVGLEVYDTKRPMIMSQQTTFPAVFVKRELGNSSFSTICLPFNIDDVRDLPDGNPFRNAEILEFTNATQQGEGDDQVTTLHFTSVTQIKAGKPYLIKTTLTGEVTCTGANNEGITCPVISDTASYGGLDVTYNGITFHGVLTPQPTLPNNANTLFLVADNRLANIVGQSTVNLKGLRAFFTVSEPALQGKIELRLPEKTVTSIPTFSIDTIKPTKYLWDGKIYIQRGNNVYDLSGNCVR